MICTHCFLYAPVSCGLPRAAKASWNGIARAWRAALGMLGQLG
jgi:hypothetical protein